MPSFRPHLAMSSIGGLLNSSHALMTCWDFSMRLGRRRISEAMNSQTSDTVLDYSEVDRLTPELSAYEQRLRVLEHYVQLLIIRTSMGEYWIEGLQDVGNHFAAFPLATVEYSSVNRHLQNAAEYCKQAEFGAATFELRILRGHLQRL